MPHGPVAEGVSGPLGTVVPYATAVQRATFERGLRAATRRFERSTGLGPAFNVTFCGSCHEKPVFGGSAGLYRNFFIAGQRTESGAFIPSPSAESKGGVVRVYQRGADRPDRPEVEPFTTHFAQRNPIPFFGVGLIAELSEEEIRKRADPDDLDGDGISGRANSEGAFVGRFGLKAQTASIEGFIRGPLFNHLGITSGPLTDELRAALPVDSSAREVASLTLGLRPAQAAVNDEALSDEDGVADPEISVEALFDLVSFSMLMAAPEVAPESEATAPGRALFDEAGCGDCHTPRLEGPRGPLPVYSDLLLHDMGPALADGLVQGGASGAEFRTQPLWGITAVGPYLHDGRAQTLEEAILWHGGEAERARDTFETFTPSEKRSLITFLDSLGGADQRTGGLLPPDAPLPEVGALGGPVRALSAEEQARFESGRRLFDHEFGLASGVGGPRFNGDSCRACHFEPVLGGAGPAGVNVMRHGILRDGRFVPPAVGTILHKVTALLTQGNVPEADVGIFESRNTPHLFGLGLIDGIQEADILSAADPDDTRTPDGISGKASYTDDGRLGRFGWKAQVPSIEEFVRDAVTAELGMTLPYEPGLTFGHIHDNDDVPDPEFSGAQAEQLAFFLRNLAPPPRKPSASSSEALRGEALFASAGCTDCHRPSLPGADGPVPLYSDLLLHDILPEDAVGIEEASATMREFRTPPLWGLSDSAPYLHNGEAETISDAVLAHDGEASAARRRFEALTDDERADLIAFLRSL